MPRQNTVKRKDNIMVWRVISCFSIFIIHLAHSLNIQGSLRVVADFGYTSVYFFIAISGYLAFAGYREGMKAVDYWKKRAVKILPLYYLVILYFFVAHTFFFKDVPADEYGIGWFRYVFFLSNIFPSEHDFWRNIGMTWTVNWLLILYICTPFLHKLIDSFNKAVAFCVISYVVYFFRKPLIGEWAEVLGGFFFYAIGFTVFFAIKEEKERLFTALLVGGAFFFVIQTASHELTGITLFGILLMATDGMQLKDGYFKKVVSWMDRYCFEFYLIHGIVFNDILWNYMSRRGFTSPVLVITVPLVCTVVISVAVHELLRVAIYDRIDSSKMA